MLNLCTFICLADSSLQGDGSAENPYQISTKGEFTAFADIVIGGDNDACAILLADIELDYLGSNGAYIKTTSSAPYSGTFDGKDYTITYDMGGIGGTKGLFAYTQNATIKNLKLTGTVAGSSHAIGSVCAYADGGRFENIISSVNISSNGESPQNYGGLIGKVTSAITMDKCAYTGNMTLGTWAPNAGGLFGGNEDIASIVTNSYVSGNITGGNVACGFAYYGNFKNCYFSGNIYSAFAMCTTSMGTLDNVYYCGDNVFEGQVANFKKGTEVSANQFASGEIAYRLGENFGQLIGTDLTPVFANEDNTVYTDGIIYSNTILDPEGVKQFGILKDGKSYSGEIVQGDELSVKAIIVDNGNNTGNTYFLSYVIYNGRQMRNIGFTKIGITEKNNSGEIEIMIPEGDDISIKAFLWNNFEDMKVIKKYVELK